MAPSYEVTAPLVVMPDKSGSDRYLYKGAPVPEDVDQDHLKGLIEAGMVGEVQAPEPADDGPPAKSASKAAWVAYATDPARAGDALSTEDAEAMTRDQLAEKYSA